MSSNRIDIQDNKSHPETKTSDLSGQERCKLKFPREYRKLAGRNLDWEKLYNDWEAASSANLTEGQKELFHSAREKGIDRITDKDVTNIYNSISIKDGLGYELIELCSQELKDKIYEKYSLDLADVNTLLIFAILCNKSDKINEMLDSNSDKDVQIDGNNHSLQQYSAVISNGNNWFKLRNGQRLYTPLQLATKYGYKGIAEILLEKGANVNCAHVPNRSINELSYQVALSPLEVAILSNQKKMVHFLLNRKDINFSSEISEAAAENGSWDICKLLHKKGAVRDPDKLFEKARSLCDEEINKDSLYKSLETLWNDVDASNLTTRNKLLIACKTNELVKVIKHPASTQCQKEEALKDFHRVTKPFASHIPAISRFIEKVGIIIMVAAIGAGMVWSLGILGIVGLIGFGLYAGGKQVASSKKHVDRADFEAVYNKAKADTPQHIDTKPLNLNTSDVSEVNKFNEISENQARGNVFRAHVAKKYSIPGFNFSKMGDMSMFPPVNKGLDIAVSSDKEKEYEQSSMVKANKC